MAKKATILDVARAAEVSIATVSRVLNNPEAVKNSTRLRVQRAFEEVGYSVDPSVPLLMPAKDAESGPRTPDRMVLTIVPDLRNPFYSDVLDGIISTADYRGYEALICRAKMERYTLKQLRRLVERTNVCGLLLLGRIAAAEDLEEIDRQLPVVQCTEFEKNSDLPYVSIDDYSAAKSAVQLLLGKGRRRIALLNGPAQFKYAEERERGYCDALQEVGVPYDPQLVIHQSASDFELALATVTRLLSGPDRPDAIFAVSDVLAVAAIRAAHRAGLDVPGDLSVVGFDDTFISQMCEPPLTTVRQRGSQIGSYACGMLLDRVCGLPVANRQILVDVDLLVRDSD